MQPKNTIKTIVGLVAVAAFFFILASGSAVNKGQSQDQLAAPIGSTPQVFNTVTPPLQINATVGRYYKFSVSSVSATSVETLVFTSPFVQATATSLSYTVPASAGLRDMTNYVWRARAYVRAQNCTSPGDINCGDSSLPLSFRVVLAPSTEKASSVLIFPRLYVTDTSNTLWSFDPTSNVWTRASTAPTATLYVTDASNRLFIFDANKNIWNPVIPVMPTGDGSCGNPFTYPGVPFDLTAVSGIPYYQFEINNVDQQTCAIKNLIPNVSPTSATASYPIIASYGLLENTTKYAYRSRSIVQNDNVGCSPTKLPNDPNNYCPWSSYKIFRVAKTIVGGGDGARFFATGPEGAVYEYIPTDDTSRGGRIGWVLLTRTGSTTTTPTIAPADTTRTTGGGIIGVATRVGNAIADVTNAVVNAVTNVINNTVSFVRNLLGLGAVDTGSK